MTLGVILLVSLSCAAAEPPAVATLYQNAQQETSASKPTAANNTQGQGTAQSPSKTTPAQKAAAQNQPPAKKPRQKKKTPSADCTSADTPATGSGAAGSASPGTAPPQSIAQGTAPASTAEAPLNCPPPRVVVPQGGTSEPNIQLAGGPVGKQASQQRESANRMLAATEQNLEKIAGRELTSSQQDMVNQTRQFMEQAKAALAAEDFDRAGTLAWKAQLLSEELANPQK